MPAAAVTALLLILAFPPFDFGWAAWVALLPWLLELEGCDGRRAFLQGTLTGFLFFAGTVWWVGYVSVPGTLILAAYLALYFGAWGWLAWILLRRSGAWKILLGLPAAWVVLEYLRSFLLSGFGWNLLAHTQWNWIPLIQIADATGVWGVSFLVVLVNVALFQGLRRRPGRRICVCATVLCLLGTGAYGVLRVQERERFDSQRLTTPLPQIVLLQGNIPQPQKWDEAFQEAIWKRYEQLTAQAAALKPALIVWPETAVPGYWEEPAIADRLQGISRSAGIPMLVGVPTEDLESGLPYNSAIFLGGDGKERARYSKIHLVPFGEFIPIKPVFGWLKRFYPVADFAPGGEWTVFSAKGRDALPPFSVLVCFEDLFPDLCRRFVRRGAEGFLVITNDAWFGRSAASIQHLQCSVFRAVENRVWVGRSANTGWTGFIDPLGRRFSAVHRFKAGMAAGGLPVSAAGGSAYVRWGDWFPLLCLGLAVWAIMTPTPKSGGTD